MSWDGTEEPSAPDLLDIARQTLLDSVLTHVSGEVRFRVLMVANAMAIASRSARLGSAEIASVLGDADVRALCTEIRAGLHDPGTPSHEATGRALLALAEARCRISAPKALG
jgi:hypothetical protein